MPKHILMLLGIMAIGSSCAKEKPVVEEEIEMEEPAREIEIKINQEEETKADRASNSPREIRFNEEKTRSETRAPMDYEPMDPMGPMNADWGPGAGSWGGGGGWGGGGPGGPWPILPPPVPLVPGPFIDDFAEDDGFDDGDDGEDGDGEGEGDDGFGDDDDCDPSCCADLTGDDVEESMDTLFKVFQKEDGLFNSSNLGPNASQIAQLGYYGDHSQVIALGPPTAVGTFGPGATAAIGVTESSELEAFILSQIKDAYGPQTTMTQLEPKVTTFWRENRRAIVNTRANILNSNGTLVAILRGLAEYDIPCLLDDVPVVDWIEFTLEVVVPPTL